MRCASIWASYSLAIKDRLFSSQESIKMKGFLLFLASALAAKNATTSNSTIWEVLTGKSNENSSLFASLLNSTRFAPVIKQQLNNTGSNATLFVPLDSFFVNGEQRDSSFDDEYAPIAPLNATVSDWLRYHIATNGTINFSTAGNATNSSGYSSNSSAVMRTLLKNSTLVNLPGGNSTGQVILAEQQLPTGNNTFIYDGQWPPACVANRTIASNGQIVYLDRALRIPRNLDDALSQNALFGFQRALLEQGKLKMANSTAGITVFAPMRFGAFDQMDASSFLVNSTTVYFPKNGTLTSMSGSELVISTSERDGSTLVNGTRIVKQDILIANGVLHVLEGDRVPCDPTEQQPNQE
jgi:hypothetical protein